MADLVPHILTVGTSKYAMSLPDNYTDISSQVGVVKAPDPDNTAYVGGGSVSELRADVLIVVLKARLEVATNTYKYRNIVCAIDKARAAPKAIVGKNFAGLKIKSARVARRMRLG